jgi:hypothetical protein
VAVNASPPVPGSPQCGLPSKVLRLFGFSALGTPENRRQPKWVHREKDQPRKTAVFMVAVGKE